jgi:hypothetical protein
MSEAKVILKYFTIFKVCSDSLVKTNVNGKHWRSSKQPSRTSLKQIEKFSKKRIYLCSLELEVKRNMTLFNFKNISFLIIKILIFKIKKNIS